MDGHQDERADHEITKAIVRIPLDRDLPVGLIGMLVKARMKKIEVSSL